MAHNRPVQNGRFLAGIRPGTGRLCDCQLGKRLRGTILVMRCACADLYRLDGAEAREYAAEHLVQTGATDFESWTVSYECPGTRRMWLLDYPHSEYHGGGSPRLRQLDPSGAPIIDQGVDPFA